MNRWPLVAFGSERELSQQVLIDSARLVEGRTPTG